MGSFDRVWHVHKNNGTHGFPGSQRIARSWVSEYFRAGLYQIM